MKQTLYFLTLTLFLFMSSCTEMQNGHELIGRKGVIQYAESEAHIDYKTETELQWTMVYSDGTEATGSERVYYERLSDELHFLNWIEKDGQTISQVINTKTKEVKTFWSFSDADSPYGGRSSKSLKGVFSYNDID